MAEDKSVQQMQAAGARVLQATPGLAERLASGGGRTSSAVAKTHSSVRDDRDVTIADLQRQLEGEKEKNRTLEDQYKYRVATFVKRETQTKNKIESLEKRLSDGPEADEHMQRMAVIEGMHKSVVSGLECIQNNTAKILQDQEKDLMRAFRARLQDVSKDLEAQRSRKGEHSTELQARHRRVVAELHEAQELAQTFDKKNQQLTAENQRLQEKLRTREDDRQALLRELVLARKEAARLKASAKEGANTPSAGDGRDDEAPAPRRRSFSQRQLEQARQQSTHNRQYEREVSYREALQKLKRMVESERQVVRDLKRQQAEFLQHRTELEVLLRQCLDDVKAEVARHHAQYGAGRDLAGSAKQPVLDEPASATVPLHQLSAADRERVLELLLSQQRVVQLLYTKTFPGQIPSQEDPTKAAAMLAAPATKPEPAAEEVDKDDFSWLSNIIPADS